MNRKIVCLGIVLLVASAAEAAWAPLFEPTYVQLRPGDSADLPVRGVWLSGLTVVPFTPMTFSSDDETVAFVSGSLLTTAPDFVRITARQPGVTRIRSLRQANGGIEATSPVIVVAEKELPVSIGVSGVPATGHSITLSAISNEPDATFTWYAGRLGGPYTWEVGSGRDFIVEPTAPATYEYWVLMTSPRGAGAAGVHVQVTKPPTRRRPVIR